MSKPTYYQYEEEKKAQPPYPAYPSTSSSTYGKASYDLYGSQAKQSTGTDY